MTFDLLRKIQMTIISYQIDYPGQLMLIFYLSKSLWIIS